MFEETNLLVSIIKSLRLSDIKSLSLYSSFISFLYLSKNLITFALVSVFSAPKSLVIPDPLFIISNIKYLTSIGFPLISIVVSSNSVNNHLK